MFTPRENITLRHRRSFANGQPVYEDETAAAAVIEEETRKKNGITADGTVFIIAPPAEAAIGDIICWQGAEYHIENLRRCRSIDGRLCGTRCTALK